MGIRSKDIEFTELNYIGTIFYEVTEKQLQDYYKHEKNIVAKYIVETYGFDALNLDQMYGSAVIDGVLYICDTSGSDMIDIDGEEVDPEEVLDIYDPEVISEYIEPATDDIIKKFVSPYDFDVAHLDLDDIAYELLRLGHHFKTIVEDAKDIDLLDDIFY